MELAPYLPPLIPDKVHPGVAVTAAVGGVVPTPALVVTGPPDAWERLVKLDTEQRLDPRFHNVDSGTKIQKQQLC